MADHVYVVVHPVVAGGRSVVAHVHGEDQALGFAHAFTGVIDLLRAAGLETAAGLPPIRWLGGGPEEWGD
ncbi:hypothetical protein ACIGFK_17805 [Streptomyces sp. NPDC085524]|uniref:hypothetical protein n=1 Tax=unclassified Streptomyces TaxID=2593676 RepID=UPI0035D6E99E